MSLITVQARTRAPAAEIWKLWTDVESSPDWDVDVAWSRLHGPFQEGTSGEFKLKGGPRLKFVLTEVSRGRGYVNLVRLPGISVCFTHALSRISAGELHIIHGAELRGPVGRLLRPLLRKPLSAALAKALANMVRLAEQRAAELPAATAAA